jgi:hypothetical protein
MTLPELPGVLSPAQIQSTADAIVEQQQPDGMILWFPGGHADPWNHTEAAMALSTAGRWAEHQRAFEWLAATQHDDGGWFTYYLVDGIEDPRRDTNVSTYVAVGVWHHWLRTGDRAFVEWAWPMVDKAMSFALGLQQPGGEVLWSYEPDGRPGEFALLTGSSSVFLSLRAAIAVAGVVREPRPEWELAATRLGLAIAHRPSAFEPKHRWAMDWYYPVLSGAVRGDAAAGHLDDRWDEFVMNGLGCRCVNDGDWITAAETAELVLTLDAIGRTDEGRRLMTWVQYLRDADGSYWTGCVHPQEVHFPGGEHSSYTAAAMLLAAERIGGLTPAGGLFRGEGGLPVLELDSALEPDLEL